jgi:hypothetical protein
MREPERSFKSPKNNFKGSMQQVNAGTGGTYGI